MRDVLETLRTYLVAQTPLTTLTSTRIYAGRTYPPENYTPGQHTITFNARGGTLDYSSTTSAESFTFKCYGSSPNHAMTLYRKLVDVLHDKRGPGIRHAELEVTGYPLQEPETDWHYVLCFFRVFFRPEL